MIGLDNLDGVIRVVRAATSNANASAGLVSGKLFAAWNFCSALLQVYFCLVIELKYNIYSLKFT